MRKRKAEEIKATTACLARCRVKWSCGWNIELQSQVSAVLRFPVSDQDVPHRTNIVIHGWLEQTLAPACISLQPDR